MSRGELVCEVRNDEIIVTLPGTRFSVTYFKPAELPQLIAKKLPRENEKGAAHSLLGKVSQSVFSIGAEAL